MTEPTYAEPMKLPALFALALVGCAATEAGSARVPAPEHVAAAPEVVSERPGATLELSTPAEEHGVVVGTLRLPALAGVLVFGGRDGALSELVARDADGPLELTPSAATPQRTRLTPNRPVRGPLVVQWKARADAPAGTTRPFAAIAEATELRVVGSDVMVLPEDDALLALTITLRLGGAEAEAASSFALGGVQSLNRRPSELFAATYLAGDLGHAEFRAADGDDFTVWAGYTSFDGRWVGAETASTRAAIDDWMGMPPDKRKGTSSLLLPEPREAPTVALRLSVRGLVASVDPRAGWTSPVRLRAAQALVQRYLGGALWVGDRDRARSGAYFSEGFSRAVAGQVLFEGGIFEHGDRAAELNSLFAMVDLSRLGHATLRELETVDDEREALRVLTARGALVALAFDHALSTRKTDPGSLKRSVRAWLDKAAKDSRDSMEEPAFLAALEAASPKLVTALTQGDEPPLPKNLLGPCYRFERGPVAPFELGFDVKPTEKGLAIQSVISGSAAARAGLTSGDVLTELRFEDQRPDVPVVAHKRALDGSVKTVTFLPAGTKRPGRRFVRVGSVPDSACR